MIQIWLEKIDTMIVHEENKVRAAYPLMLMSTMDIHSSTCKFRTLLSNMTPALFTRISMRP